MKHRMMGRRADKAVKVSLCQRSENQTYIINRWKNKFLVEDVGKMEEKYILRGPDIKLTSETFGQIVYKGLKNGGSKIAMVDALTDKNITYNDILKLSIGLAEYFKKVGLSKNDCVAVCSENNLKYCIPTISGFYLGIAVSLICHELTESELIHVLKLAKPKIIFCSEKTIENIIKVSGKLGFAMRIILLENCSKNLRYEELEDILSKDSPADQYKLTLVEPDHNALILFSSGTTGLPKGVVHSHKNLQGTYIYNSHPHFGNLNSNKVGMGLSPFYFGFGFIRVISMLITNMKVVILPKFSKHLFLNSIQKYKITNIFVAPALVLFLAKSPLVDDFDLSSIKEIMSSASVLGKDITELATKRLNLNNIRQGYGLTETFALAMFPACSNRPGAVGKLVPGWQCKVIDPDTNEVLGPYNQGELCVRGAMVMKGYVDNSVATAEIIDEDGWLHTGDAVYYDDDEFLYIVDRYKELIKYKGFHVPPAEIEDLLLKHPQILDCAVIGKPDKIVGELPIAFVVKQANANITEKEILKYVTENISYQKRLHGGVQFVKEIPKNATGKILRRVLKMRLLHASKL